jgi:hemolysin D
VTSGELDAARSNYYHTRLEMDRIQAGLNGGRFALGRAGATAGAQGRLFNASQSSLKKQLESKTEELNRVKEEYKQSQAEISKNQELLARCNEKHARMEQVIDIIARDEWDKNESEITTYKGNIEQLGHKLTELSHQQQQVEAEIQKIGSDFEMTNLEDWSEKQKTATELNSRVRELSFKRRKQTLISPVDGWVDTMYLHTVGGVVAPGEKILSITPSKTRMVVQASVSNRDIGFIQKGMKTQLKVDTFDFQKYGMFEGKVKLVSTDSHDSESKQMPGGHEQTEKKLEQVYEVLIEPTTKSLLVEGKQQPLASGMTLTAEINIGKRKIIEFFIYPLIKYWHNGITVR